MKITDNRKGAEYFTNLSIGDFFIYDNCLCMKIDNDTVYDFDEEITFNMFESENEIVTPISKNQIEIIIKG